VDGDGQLSKLEFTRMLGKMGLNLTSTEVDRLFAKTDIDRKSSSERLD